MNLPFFNFRRDKNGSSSHKREDSTVSVQTVSYSPGSKEDVSTDCGAQRIAAALRCSHVICDSIASLPLKYLRKSNAGTFEDYDTHPFHYMLECMPQSDMYAYMWKYMLAQRLVWKGEAFIYPRYISSVSYPVELVLLDNQYCRYDKWNRKYYINDVENGVSGEFKPEQIIHPLFNTFDGKTGVGIIEYARRTMSIAATGENELLKRFSDGGTPKGFIASGTDANGNIFGEYNDDELSTLANDVDKLLRNGAQIVSLPGHASFQQVSMSSADLQFLEQRKLQIVELCRIFGVHPSKIFSDTSTNYKSAENAQGDFMNTTLNPILTNIECSFNSILVEPTMHCKRKFQFDRDALYACDKSTRLENAIKSLQSGHSVNEVRLKANLAPVDGGETPLVSANLVQVGSKKLTGE